MLSLSDVGGYLVSLEGPYVLETTPLVIPQRGFGLLAETGSDTGAALGPV